MRIVTGTKLIDYYYTALLKNGQIFASIWPKNCLYQRASSFF